MTREEFEALSDKERDVIATSIGVAVSLGIAKHISCQRIRELFHEAATFDAMWISIQSMAPAGSRIVEEATPGAIAEYQLHDERQKTRQS